MPGLRSPDKASREEELLQATAVSALLPRHSRAGSEANSIKPRLAAVLNPACCFFSLPDSHLQRVVPGIRLDT